MRYSSPAILISAPEYLPNRMRSPAFTSSATRSPVSSSLPLPTAFTSACCGFSLAESGMMMPPTFCSPSSRRVTITRSCKGRKSMPQLYRLGDRHEFPAQFAASLPDSPSRFLLSGVLDAHRGEFAEFGVEGQDLTVSPCTGGVGQRGVDKAPPGSVLPGKTIHRFEEKIRADPLLFPVQLPRYYNVSFLAFWLP